MTDETGPGRSYTASLADGDSASLWSWRISEYQLKRQVAEYDTLRLTQSYRGIAALLTAAAGVVGVLAKAAGWLPLVSTAAILVVGVFYLGFAWFIYLGHRWALMTMMVIWTLDKWWNVYATRGFAVAGLIYWVIWMKFYLNAWRVEQARREPQQSTTV
jgi:hypothetical protein